MCEVETLTFDTCFALQIQLLFVNLESRKCTFALHDRVQSKLTMEMDTTSFRIVTAMFAHYLQQRLGKSIVEDSTDF